jgi:hypothetical protein
VSGADKVCVGLGMLGTKGAGVAGVGRVRMGAGSQGPCGCVHQSTVKFSTSNPHPISLRSTLPNDPRTGAWRWP